MIGGKKVKLMVIKIVYVSLFVLEPIKSKLNENNCILFLFNCTLCCICFVFYLLLTLMKNMSPISFRNVFEVSTRHFSVSVSCSFKNFWLYLWNAFIVVTDNSCHGYFSDFSQLYCWKPCVFIQTQVIEKSISNFESGKGISNYTFENRTNNGLPVNGVSMPSFENTTNKQINVINVIVNWF